MIRFRLTLAVVLCALTVWTFHAVGEIRAAFERSPVVGETEEVSQPVWYVPPARTAGF